MLKDITITILSKVLNASNEPIDQKNITAVVTYFKSLNLFSKIQIQSHVLCKEANLLWLLQRMRFFGHSIFSNWTFTINAKPHILRILRKPSFVAFKHSNVNIHNVGIKWKECRLLYSAFKCHFQKNYTLNFPVSYVNILLS